MTSTRADAEAAVRAVRYPPAGERFWGPFYAPHRWGVSAQEYLDRADDEILAMGTIEHVNALQSIGEVIATPGRTQDKRRQDVRRQDVRRLDVRRQDKRRLVNANWINLSFREAQRRGICFVLAPAESRFLPSSGMTNF